MKRLLFSLIILYFCQVNSLKAQELIRSDNFETTTFPSSIGWLGNTDKFVIDDINSTKRLRLNAVSGETKAFIALPDTIAFGSIQFDIFFNFTGLSGSNKFNLYFALNKSNPDGQHSGYALQGGESGSADVFKLMRVTNGSTTALGSDTTLIDKGGAYRIKIDRDTTGLFTVSIGRGANGTLNSFISVRDTMYTEPGYVVFEPNFTSTRITSTSFDEVELKKYRPFLKSASVKTEKTISLIWSESLDQSNIQTNQFTVKPANISPTSFSLNANKLTLTFTNPLPEGDFSLEINPQKDLHGISSASFSTPLKRDVAFTPGTIQLSEFMHNPPTNVVDYIELQNLSSNPIDIGGWIVRDNNATNYSIPANTSIKANSFIVLTNDTTALFNHFGTRNYAQMSSFPGLNNTTTDQVRVYTSNFVLVDSLQYEISWGGSGIALERKSSTVKATFPENWGVSLSPLKGTPGLANQVALDTTPPSLKSAFVISADTVSVQFSESIAASSVQLNSTFSLDGGIVITEIKSVNASTFKLKVSPSLTQNQAYTLTISGISDIFSNAISSPIDTTIQLIIAQTAIEGDILISEFIYDPPTGYTEAIELVNNSSKYIDLKNFTYNDNSGTRKVITSSTTIFRPGEYIVIAPSLSLQSVFPDAQIISMGSNFAALNNSGDQIVIRSNSGKLLDSLEYTTAWGGTKFSLERRSKNVSARHKENWGNSPNALFATLGKANEVAQDLTAPSFVRANVTYADSLVLTFSEQLKSDVATNNASYSLVNRTISSVRLAGNQVILGIQPALEANKSYSGSIISLSDLFGNSISAPIAFTFEFVESETALKGEVVITEFMFDPPTGYSEFIELQNISNKVFDLANWTYNDNSGSPKAITDKSSIFRPGEIIVLSPDDKLASFFPDARIINMGSSFAALNNAGDQIVIKNSAGITLDSLEYNSSWGGSKVSLERRMNNVSATFAENWGNSPSGLFASLGKPNTVAQDTEAPNLLTILSDSVSISLVFNERIDANFAQISTISTSLNMVEQSRIISGSVIKITFTSELQTSTTFSVTCGPQKDIFGNVSNSFTRETAYIIVRQPALGDIILTEFVYRASDTTPEFIEIYNTSAENIDLRSLKIADNKETVSLIFNTGFISYIKPNQYLAISTDEGFVQGGLNRTAVSKLPSLNDTGSDAIVIKTTKFTLDSLTYSFPLWQASAAGQSFERRDKTEIAMDPINWGLNKNRSHSAGLENTVSGISASQQITFAGWINPDTLTIYTSRFIKSPATIEVYLNDELLLNPKIKNNRIKFALAQPSSFDDLELELRDTDVVNPITSISKIAVQLGQNGVEPFIITEIMFNPLNTETSKQSDYIEFYNPNSFSVILPNPLVTVKSVTSSSTTLIQTVSSGIPQSIRAGAYGIIFADTSLSISTSRLGTYFVLNDTLSFRAARTTLSLSSTNSAVLLKTQSGVVMDSVQYKTTWHNPNVTDTRGRSLERVLLHGSSNDPTNWSTSGAVLGGTPGKINTNFVEPGEAKLNELDITPNPFSPDEDGFEDNTTITWNLDGASYVISATIYDRYGRKVRTLAEGVVGAKTGSLVWDGKRDDGTYNRVGIYIILFKAIDNNNGKQFIKKETLVIARKL